MRRLGRRQGPTSHGGEQMKYFRPLCRKVFAHVYCQGCQTKTGEFHLNLSPTGTNIWPLTQVLRNHGVAWAGRDLKDDLTPDPCHRQGCHPLGRVGQGPIQTGLKHLQDGTPCLGCPCFHHEVGVEGGRGSAGTHFLTVPHQGGCRPLCASPQGCCPGGWGWLWGAQVLPQDRLEPLQSRGQRLGLWRQHKLLAHTCEVLNLQLVFPC